MRQEISGAVSALITPFTNGCVDFETYHNLIKRQIRHGMHACVPVGTTGESATLSHDEHKSCIEVAVDACKNSDMKVIAGAGSNSTKEAIELAQFAEGVGADMVLCVTPYYNKPSQRGLYEHFVAIAKSIDIPLILYNVPSRTGVFLESSTIISLYSQIKNIIAIKESSGVMERIVELNSKSDIAIFSGDDALNYPIISNGGMGAISVTGNLLPDKISQLVNSALSGDYALSKSINDELFEINQALFYESNPILIKAAMFLSGLIKSLEYRLPLTPPSKESLEHLEKTLEKYEVLK